VKQINSPFLGIYPDSGNIQNAAVECGTDVYEDLKLGFGYITSLHLKETLPGKFREIPYGTGHVDFEKMIQNAWNMGIRKYVTEFWYTGNEKWREDLAETNMKMRSILNKIAQRNTLLPE
jgi:L-ribulose-5-phosphate 3-epimerase